MDRQNMILAAIAVVVLVAAGAFVFWPRRTDRATVAGEPSPGQSAAGDSASSTRDGDY